MAIPYKYSVEKFVSHQGTSVMNNYTEFSYGIFLVNNEKKLEKHEIIAMLCISTVKSHVTDEATRHVPCMTIYDMIYIIT